MRILIVTPEANPFARTGVLAEVVSSLAWALTRLGHQVMVVMPHTSLHNAAIVADRIRARVSEVKPPPSLSQIRVSTSIAVASTDNDTGVSFGLMVQKAMRGLREAEMKGGDLVVVCSGGGSDKGQRSPGGELGPRIYFV